MDLGYGPLEYRLDKSDEMDRRLQSEFCSVIRSEIGTFDEDAYHKQV